MDDEAFARMLQQQLLDEERLLMEQEQQQQQQQQQHPPQQQHYPPPTHNHPPGGYSNYPYGQPQPAPPQQSGFDPNFYDRGLQQRGSPNDYGPGGTAQGPSPHQTPYNPNSPQYPYQGGHPAQQQTHYQPNYQHYQQYPGVPPGQAPYNGNPAQYPGHEDQNLAAARRMHEMQAMGQGQGYHQAPPPAQYNTSYGNPPYYNTGGGPPNVDRSQEEEDARIARLLEETGQSFRQLDLQGIGGNQQVPLPLSSKPMVQRPVVQATPQPLSIPGPKAPPSFSDMPVAVRSTSNPMPSRLGGEPPLAEYSDPQSRSMEFSPHFYSSEQQPPQQEFAPKAPPQYGLKVPPQYSPQAPSRHLPVASRPQNSSVGPPAGRAPVPTPPAMSRSSPANSGHSRTMDPVPVDQGPLQAGGVPSSSTRPPQQQPGWGGRVASSGTSPRQVRNVVNPGMRPTNWSEPPMMPGDAFLDVPAPAKKEKQKKKGLLGMFGRAGGKEQHDSSGMAATQKSAVPQPSSRPDSKNRGMFGGTNPKSSGARLSNEKMDPYPSEEVSKPAARALDSNVNGVEQDVVRFKIPEPVPRPVDTIGAPKGPLPYSLTVSRDAPILAEATVGRHRQISLSRSAAICAVCNQSAQNPLSALDKKFHSDCFRCITCHQLIDPTGPFAFLDSDGDKQPMHRRCYAEIFGIRCCVCNESIPAGPDGKVSFVKHPFFDSEQMCPRHARNMTRRCTGCHRFEPENEPFADLNDVGRCVCMSCCRSVVVDSHDAQPLWEKVVAFFEKGLNMPIWKDFREVPILVVGYNALNDQMNTTNNVHGGASQIMTRGLCLTEHESGRRFRMNRMKFDREHRNFVANDAEDRGFTFFQVPDASKSNPDASVTAILCLSGLPQDLSASVLAHEATHAWIKLHPRFNFEHPIPPQVEEGCAQLIALLFLNEGLDPPAPLENNDGSGPSDEKLRQYFRFSIETDEHEIYGTGYRRAALAYSKIGIEALMSHVVLYQEFPEV